MPRKKPAKSSEPVSACEAQWRAFDGSLTRYNRCTVTAMTGATSHAATASMCASRSAAADHYGVTITQLRYRIVPAGWSGVGEQNNGG